MAQPLFHVEHEIGGRQLVNQIQNRVTHQHVIIEIQDVESDHEIGSAQPRD